MGRLLLGILKGLILGGGMGYALWFTGLGQTVLAYLALGVLGATVGVICGKAPWRAETIWTPALKAIFGMVAGSGLFALGHKFLPATQLGTLLPALPAGLGTIALNSGTVLAPAVGVLYGAFVEVDDGGAEPPKLPEKAARKALPDRTAT